MSASQSGCDSFWCALGRFVRALVGIAFLVLGGFMTITFWLMPIGLPLALGGLAITLSDSRSLASSPTRRSVSTVPDGPILSVDATIQAKPHRIGA